MFILIALGVIGVVFILYRLILTGEFLPWYTRLFGIGTPEYPISGHVAKGYESVKGAFQHHFDLGREVGASVVVFSEEECVVELYGGYEDFEKKTPYSDTTLQLVYSCSKVLESIGVARLVDQGLINYDDKISSIWSGFKNGKEDVTVADLMRHEAGLTYFHDPQPDFKDMMNPDKAADIIETHPHVWDGKPVRSYHAFNRGWVTNGIVKRVDSKKRTLGKIYEEDFNTGLDCEFYLGLKRELMHRKSTWYSYPKLDGLMLLFLPSKIMSKKATPGVNLKVREKGRPFSKLNKIRKGIKDFENSEFATSGEAPSFNGFTNAKTLAKIAACMANNGKFNGFQLISEKGLNSALENPTTKFDNCLLIESTFTQAGFGVFVLPELGVDTKFYGWSGLGGSMMWFNPEYKFGFSYVMNAAHITLSSRGRSRTLLKAAFRDHLKNYKPQT